MDRSANKLMSLIRDKAVEYILIQLGTCYTRQEYEPFTLPRSKVKVAIDRYCKCTYFSATKFLRKHEN